MARIRSHRVALFALCCALFCTALATSAMAQTIQNQPETGAVTGKLKHIDTSAKMFTIHDAMGADWTFSVNKKTSFINGDKPTKLSALKEGWTVVVNYDASVGLMPTGNVALEVEVTDTP